MKFTARLDASHHGPPHPFKYVGIFEDSLDRHPQYDGEVPLHCQQELHTQGKNPQDSSLASVEAYAVGFPLPIHWP
jgi:hypothetical protein